MCPETFLSDGLKSQMKCISDSWSLTALLCDVNQILLWCLLAHSLVWLDGEFQACAYSLQSYPTQAILLKEISLIAYSINTKLPVTSLLFYL